MVDGLVDGMAPTIRPARHSMVRISLISAAAGLLVAACATAAATPPSARITFLVQNTTESDATYRFEGSATGNGVTGSLDCLAQTTIGTAWDPTWTFLVNGRAAIASTNSADLQPGAGARDGLTVIVVVVAGGVQTSAHPGPALGGEIATAPPSNAPTPACLPAPALPGASGSSPPPG